MGAVQPSRTFPSASKLVEPTPVEDTTLSMPMPRPWTEKSLAYVIETSTWRVAAVVFGSVTDQVSQPAPCPLLACQSPLVPLGLQVNSSSSGVEGSLGMTTSVRYCLRNGFASRNPGHAPISCVVLPLASGSVVQSVPPAVRASTKR